LKNEFWEVKTWKNFRGSGMIIQERDANTKNHLLRSPGLPVEPIEQDRLLQIAIGQKTNILPFHEINF
jgi:hypothetical protein